LANVASNKMKNISIVQSNAQENVIPKRVKSSSTNFYHAKQTHEIKHKTKCKERSIETQSLTGHPQMLIQFSL